MIYENDQVSDTEWFKVIRDIYQKQKEDDLYLITGVEDGWIKVNKGVWKKYLEAKKKLENQL